LKANTQNIPASIATTTAINSNSFQQTFEMSISTLKNYSKINKIYISYEKEKNDKSAENNNENNVNEVHNNSNNLKFEFFTLLNLLGETNICPFYYFNSLISQGTADLIICTYKDFFDPKNRIKIKNLIPEAERKNFKLIFDECGDIDYLIQDYFSMNIDDNILNFSSDDLFILRERYKKFAEANCGDQEMTIQENGREEINKNLIVECESIEYNGFSRKFLGIYKLKKVLTLLNFIFHQINQLNYFQFLI